MTLQRNICIEYDDSLINNVRINLSAVKKRANDFGSKRSVKKQYEAAWLLKALTCIDLTTLRGDDTPANVDRLCYKAAQPISPQLLQDIHLQHKQIHVGAVCVYPNQVKTAVDALKRAGCPEIPVASVATGFPCGQTPLSARLEEIRLAVADGACEIDIVINRTLALMGSWRDVYDEVRQMKEACGEASMKAILAVGELGSLKNVYRASMVCMMAGSDFIKTSTGKEDVNANLVVSLVMVRAIRDYQEFTGHKVGFKPAGGVRTGKEAFAWMSLMKEELGDEHTHNNLFRIGASSLLADIERSLYFNTTGCYPTLSEMPMG